MKKRLNNQEEKLHLEFSKLSQYYGKLKNKLLMLLPEIARAGIPEKLGFENIYDYALKVGGLPFSTVARALRLKKRLKDLPKLYDAIEKVGISKVEIVARVANKETEEFWTDKALNMSRIGVETSVKEELFHVNFGGTVGVKEEMLHTGVKFVGDSRACLAAPEKVKVLLSVEAQKSFNRLKKQMGVVVVGGKADEKAMEMMLRRLEGYVGGGKVAESGGTEGGVGFAVGVKVVESAGTAGDVNVVGEVKVVESAGAGGVKVVESVGTAVDVNAVGDVKVVESVGAGGVKEVESVGTAVGVGCVGRVKEVKSVGMAGGVSVGGEVKVVESAATVMVGGGGSVGAVKDVKKVGRQASAEEKREVYKRSEKICEYPGCTKAVENLHHRERFSNKKSHETLMALCKAHHEIVHNGFIVNELEAPKNWQVVSKTGGFKALGFVDQKLRALRSKVEQQAMGL